MRLQVHLLRQIHPSFVQKGRVTSQAFRPTPKDEYHLSVDNGDQVAPGEAWLRFVSNIACLSVGVQAVTYQECVEQELSVVQDGRPYPEHCSIDFSSFDKKMIERKAKILRARAELRGWLFENGAA